MKTSWLSNATMVAAFMCYHLVRSLPVNSQHLVQKRQAEYADLSQSQQANLWDEGFHVSTFNYFKVITFFYVTTLVISK